MSAYTLGATLDRPYEETVRAVRDALETQGFGVLTEIDVQATLKEKLDEDMEPYLILGACNPTLAHQGLGIEPDLGVLLPCNVVVRSDDGAVRVAAMEPGAAMRLAANPDLAPLAAEARDRLDRALSQI